VQLRRGTRRGSRCQALTRRGDEPQDGADDGDSRQEPERECLARSGQVPEELQEACGGWELACYRSIAHRIAMAFIEACGGESQVELQGV